MQLCGSIIIICWATQRHKTHTQREWKKEPAESERQRERRRDEESTFCICFVEKSNFICQKRILFIVSRVFEAHCLFYWCVFLFFFRIFSAAAALYVFENKCKPLKKLRYVTTCTLGSGSACVYVKSTNVRLFKKEKWFKMQCKNARTKKKPRDREEKSEIEKERRFIKTRDRDLNGAVGWNSLESAATNEVKIKIYVLL